MKPNPSLQPITDEAGLPRVLLIGDSISIGYTLPVRALLQGKANVHRPAANCGPTSRGLDQIDNWLGEGKWDVIHFNWGLHDLKYMGAQGQNLADPDATDSHPLARISHTPSVRRAQLAGCAASGGSLRHFRGPLPFAHCVT